MVVVFTMQGCPACAEYKPRFQRIARPYATTVPILMADVADPRFASLADRLGVAEVPATFLLRKPYGIIRAVGSVPDAQIQWIMNVAAREAAAGR